MGAMIAQATSTLQSDRLERTRFLADRQSMGGRMQRLGVLLWLYFFGLAAGCLIWLPGATDSPYHWQVRLVGSLCFSLIASLAATGITNQPWSLSRALAALAGVLTPPGTILFLLALAGPDWS